jgi:hypothetical protein
MGAVWKLLAITVLRAFAVMVLACAIETLLPGNASAQEINFDQINKFESLGTALCRLVRRQKRLSMMASGTS